MGRQKRDRRYAIAKVISIILGVIAMSIGTYTGYELGVKAWAVALGVFLVEALVYVADQWLYFWILERANRKEDETWEFIRKLAEDYAKQCNKSGTDETQS